MHSLFTWAFPNLCEAMSLTFGESVFFLRFEMDVHQLQAPPGVWAKLTGILWCLLHGFRYGALFPNFTEVNYFFLLLLIL